jgi:hypothetical protein
MKYKAVGYVKNSNEPNLPKPAFQVSSDELDQGEFEEIKKARDLCWVALGIEEKFQLVLENFREWEIELLNLSQTFLIWRNSNYDSMEHRNLLDRRLTNVLSGFRLYIDQTDHEVSMAFGKPSPELERVKKFKNDLYDTHFGYRFCEELRNHAQHCALPVQMISYQQSRAGKTQDQVQITIAPRMNTTDLDSAERFKKSILEEIKSQGGKIELRQPIRDYIFCLTLLHNELRTVFGSKLTQARRTYSEAVKKFSTMGGFSVEHPRLEALNENAKVDDRVDLITDFLDKLDELHKRNSSVFDISKTFVSNAI